MSREFAIGDIVWAKVKGYPEWPGTLTSPSAAPQSVIEQQPKPNKGLVAPPENILIHFFGSRDFAWVASTNLFDFKENYEKFYKPNQKTKYYQTAVQLAADPELAAADQARFEENETLYKNSQVAKNAEKEARRKAKREAKDAEKRKKEEEEFKQEVSILKNSRKRKLDGTHPVSKKKEKTSVAKIINNQTLLTQEKKSSLESLLRLRVKLQKFINSQTKTESDFVKVDAYMKEAEEFPVDYELFKESKIGKVLKFVSKLELPQDSFDIVNRAHILINKWRSILQDQVSEGSKDQITTFVETVIQESLNDLSNVEISKTETQDGYENDFSNQASEMMVEDSKETSISGMESALEYGAVEIPTPEGEV